MLIYDGNVHEHPKQQVISVTPTEDFVTSFVGMDVLDHMHINLHADGTIFRGM